MDHEKLSSALTLQKYRKIIANRDPRYDGQFYFGVKTTKIYCRPICPARPKPENIILFRSPTEAEKNLYRPCKRCHPDIGPNSGYHLGTNNTVNRALKYIDQHHKRNLSVPDLAEVLGVTDRHLRRLFDEYLGASPIEVIQTQRLHLAKQLLESTTGPITEIAYAVGFKSLRRFNESFKARFQKSPSSIRQSSSHHLKTNASFKFTIPVHEPYDWESTISFLKRHQANGIEIVEAHQYLRFINLQQKGVKALSYFTVQRPKKGSRLLVEFHNIPLIEVKSILVKIKDLFDTNHNPHYLPDSHIGIRNPGSFDFYETGISIIFNQLVSNQVARSQLAKFIKKFGNPIGEYQNQQIYAFPSPKDLQDQNLNNLGLTKSKISAIEGFTKLVLDLHSNKKFMLDPESLKAELLKIKGIGHWTTEMILMRCLGHPDAFPKNDLVIKRRIEDNPSLPQKWIGYRSYLTQHLWKQSSK